MIPYQTRPQQVVSTIFLLQSIVLNYFVLQKLSGSVHLYLRKVTEDISNHSSVGIAIITSNFSPAILTQEKNKSKYNLELRKRWQMRT